MQKCLTDNVVTANEEGCSELGGQSAEANSHQEVTEMWTELQSPECALPAAFELCSTSKQPPRCSRAAAWLSLLRKDFAYKMTNLSSLANCLWLCTESIARAWAECCMVNVDRSEAPGACFENSHLPQLLSSCFLSLLSTNLPRARGMFNSSIPWLWLYSALEGNYCGLENCNSYAESDIRQSNKALLIIVINGAVSKVLPITQHMSLSAHRHKHKENSFQLNLSLLPRTTIILISWYCR